ncbi:hypothetical protein B9Z55_002332 [Caenorhabditis nigoni]|uniref:Arf-GAP domain-containing protein n=1 Tax=Caenorhabditis nigoni TaxID=1611254 RepID=A0A2G5VK75_9PELO|nr:hypothetical protein B9Z55_002332 [Caenorhabditis nigoni]
MASPRTRRVLKELRPLDDNNVSLENSDLKMNLRFQFCFECEANNPHFVRSVTMDKWKDIELAKMKAGGNRKFAEFLQAQPDYKEKWTIQEKYNSRAAALFRDKLKDVNGLSLHLRLTIMSFRLSEEWVLARTPRPINLLEIHLLVLTTEAILVTPNPQEMDLTLLKIREFSNNRLFTRMVFRGSKYQGFGNTGYVPNQSNNGGDDLLAGAMSGLSMGWSMLSKGASQAAAMAKDVGMQAQQKASQLSENVSQNNSIFGGVASKASEVGTKSWDGFSQFVKSPSLNAFSGILSKTGYEDFGNGGMSGSSSQNEFNDWLKQSQLPRGTTEGATHLSSEEMKTSAEPAEIRRKKERSPKPAPKKEKVITDVVEDDSSTIAQFESSFNKPKATIPRTTPVTAAPLKKQEKEKGWDDDAWDLLNQ